MGLIFNIVRVGGSSDYFVNLDEGLQDNVIERTFANKKKKALAVASAFVFIKGHRKTR